MADRRRLRSGRDAALWCVLASVLPATSACMGMPVERTGAAEPWKPPSTDKVLAHYDEVGNAAAASRDLDLIGEVESGPLLAVSQARLRIQRLSDPDGSDTALPVIHENPKLFVPHFEGYPLWFVDQSTVETDSGETRATYGVMLLPDAGSGWRRMIEVTVADGVELPEIRTDDSGAAVPVGAELSAALARPADAIPRAYGGWIDGGLEAPHAGAFQDSPSTVELLEEFDQEQEEAAGNGWELQRKVVPTVHRSLATKGDGALVLFTLLETVKTQIGEGAAMTFEEDSQIRAYSGEEEASQSVKATYVWQVAAYVPPVGQDRDLVTLLGLSRSITSAKVG